MTALEIRLLSYIAAGLLYTGLVIWATVTLTSHHYERVEAADKLAIDQALQTAQTNVIAAQNAQKEAEQKVETEHELRTQADTVSRAAVLSSVRGLETAIHSRLLPATVANSGPRQATQSGQISASGLAGLVDRFNASLERFISACQSVDNDRTAIINLEPKGTVAKPAH